PHQPRLEGPRRAAHRAHRRRDRQRDPRRDGRRRALAADHARGDAPRAGGGAAAGGRASTRAGHGVSSDIAMAPMVGGKVAPSSAYRQALTRRGYVSEVNFLEPEDGGLAELFVDDEGCVFDLKIFTPDIASAMFELAVDARLVIYTCG